MHAKSKKKFRLKVGPRYCTLNTNYHVVGVAIPDAGSMFHAHVFDHILSANACIHRTTELQGDVRGSMMADWAKMKPLLFEGELQVEEFEPEESGE